MLDSDTTAATFSSFVRDNEARIRHALTARYGVEVGREATAEALAYAWEHWKRVADMDNPVGYVYVVGRDRGRRLSQRRRVAFPSPPVEHSPWIEPGLAGAVARLPSRQRTVVMLLYAYEWTQQEVAEVLGISKASVQRHAERGLARLRRRLGVER